MWLRKMLKICLVFWKSEPQYAYKRYAYKKTCMFLLSRYTLFKLKFALLYFLRI